MKNEYEKFENEEGEKTFSQLGFHFHVCDW